MVGLRDMANKWRGQLLLLSVWQKKGGGAIKVYMVDAFFAADCREWWWLGILFTFCCPLHNDAITASGYNWCFFFQIEPFLLCERGEKKPLAP